MTPPAQRVQFILGQESQDVEHETHPVFSEMEELIVGEDGNMEWKETARSDKQKDFFLHFQYYSQIKLNKFCIACQK